MRPDVYFAIPGDIGARTGGYEYDRRLMGALRARGRGVVHLAWAGGYPFPSEADRAAAGRSLDGVPDGATVLVDGLAYGAIPAVAAAAARRLRLVALVHHPLALETGRTADQAVSMARDEAAALRHAAAVVVTSRTTGATLVRDYGVAASRVVVAAPGTDRVAPSPARRAGPVRLLSIGALIPRKGFDVLLAALAEVAALDWTCRIVGSAAHDPVEAAAIAALRGRLSLGRRVRLMGEVAETGPFYRWADVFVLASRYEGYGMVFAEALAAGLPVIGTRGGAIPEVVPAGAGLLVAADDVGGLAGALRGVIGAPGLRAEMAAAARGVVLPSWDETAALVEGVLFPG